MVGCVLGFGVWGLLCWVCYDLTVGGCWWLLGLGDYLWCDGGLVGGFGLYAMDGCFVLGMEVSRGFGLSFVWRLWVI